MGASTIAYRCERLLKLLLSFLKLFNPIIPILSKPYELCIFPRKVLEYADILWYKNPYPAGSITPRVMCASIFCRETRNECRTCLQSVMITCPVTISDFLIIVKTFPFDGELTDFFVLF